jgi:phosphoglycerate dehydrogenase-like enzyme
LGTESRAAATAKLAMTLILDGSREMVREAVSMRDGGWQAGLGRDLDGLTLGVIGLVRLGAEVARLARTFGMEILAWSANLTDERCAKVEPSGLPRSTRCWSVRMSRRSISCFPSGRAG